MIAEVFGKITGYGGRGDKTYIYVTLDSIGGPVRPYEIYVEHPDAIGNEFSFGKKVKLSITMEAVP